MARTLLILAASLVLFFAGGALGQPLGDVHQAGTTWCGPFTCSTVGRLIGVDNLGGVHVVWTNAFDRDDEVCHSFYNTMAPGSTSFSFEYGQQIDVSPRATCPNVAVLGEGWCFPAYSEHRPGGIYAGYRCAAGIDFLPGIAAFVSSHPAEPDDPGPPSFSGPKITVSPDSVMHMVCTEQVAGTALPRVYYSRGHPRWDSEGFGLQVEWETMVRPWGYLLLDTAKTSATNIACSRVSDRVAIVYGKEHPDNSVTPPVLVTDLMLKISEDGGLNWQPAVNVTQFHAADTLRLNGDCGIIFDEDDHVHLAFTALIPENPADSTRHPGRSGIWHWSEAFGEFTPVATHYYCLDGPTGPLTPPLGGGVVRQPNLAIDETTGDLFCAYQRYMAGQWSSENVPMADVFVSRSCNNGRVWSAGVNVTRTDGGQNTQSPDVRNEESPSMAERVSYENGDPLLHLAYFMDRGPGLESGHNSLVEYQQLTADLIPVRPVLNPFWPALHVDLTGYPAFSAADTVGDHLCSMASASQANQPVPEVFRLDQNYPNPFNAATRISFRLTQPSRVTLTVYNVLGQAVSVLHDHVLLQPGSHTVAFDAGQLSSGLYFCRLDAGVQSSTIKMILLR